MKTRILLVLLAIGLLFSFACKKKSDNLPDEAIARQITTFVPLPSFKQVYQVLDNLSAKDISQAVPKELYKSKQEEMRNAFSLGVLTADAVLAARGRNTAKLQDISAQMMALTGLLGLETEISKMGDDLKTKIENQDWDALDIALDEHKKSVEDVLWDTENFDNYTLMAMGGWVEAANRVAWLINQNYDANESRILSQKANFNNLVLNAKGLESAHITEQEAFQAALKHLIAVQSIINSDTDGTYSKEQISTIIEGTEAIKAAFQN